MWSVGWRLKSLSSEVPSNLMHDGICSNARQDHRELQAGWLKPHGAGSEQSEDERNPIVRHLSIAKSYSLCLRLTTARSNLDSGQIATTSQVRARSTARTRAIWVYLTRTGTVDDQCFRFIRGCYYHHQKWLLHSMSRPLWIKGELC